MCVYVYIYIYRDIYIHTYIHTCVYIHIGRAPRDAPPLDSAAPPHAALPVCCCMVYQYIMV